MVGTFANIISEIKRRINICVPSLYSTDPFLYIDNANLEGENNTNPFLFRHFYVELTDNSNGDYAGNYSYKNKNCTLTVSLFYNENGANRVLGTDDINFRAFALQDSNDIEDALRNVITTEDGSTARLIFAGSAIDSDGKNIVVNMNYDLPVFLRGEQKVPNLYIGPNQSHTLDAGTKFYLVCQSDLPVEVAVTSAPEGLEHVAGLVLGSGTPSVIECTVEAAGTYTITITGKSGTAAATVVVYPDSDYVYVGPDIAIPNDVWTYNLAVASVSNGTLDVTGSANLTLPATVEIVNNKGIIPITIVSRGSHTVTVGDDTCNLTSVLPSTTIPYYNNQYYQIDPVVNSNSPSCTIVSTGCGEYAIVQDPDVNGNLLFTFAYRYKPVFSTLATSGSWIYVGSGQSSTYANWAIGNYAYLTRPVIYYRNYENSANNTHYLNAPYLIQGNWYDIVFSYTYNINTQVGELKQYIDGNLQNTIILGATGRMGYVHNDAVRTTKTIQALYMATGQFQFYDIYISNNYAWDSDDVSVFAAKSTIDPDHYTLYWPLQKNTDLPYLVDYDRKNNVPLYIPGPHPEIEWVAKP